MINGTFSWLKTCQIFIKNFIDRDERIANIF